MNYTKEEQHEALNWLLQNGYRKYNKTDVNALIRVNRKFKILNKHFVVKSEAMLPLREFIEAVDEYVYEQENHEIKRTPQRMSTIKCVAHWCKRFAEHLAK